MRTFFYILPLLMFSMGTITAQIVELPLEHHGQLQQQNPTTERSKLVEFDEQQAEAALRALDITTSTSIATFRGDNDRVDTSYIISGDTIKFCAENLGQKNKFQLIRKTEFYGQFVPVDTTNRCWFYQSKKDITLGIDTFRLLRTTLNGTIDTFSRIVVVHRTQNTVTMPLNVLKPNQDIIVCLPISQQLKGIWNSSTLLNTVDIASELHKYSSWLDSCIYFKASRQKGTRYVNYKVCDNYKLCTIFKIPFEVQNEVISLATEGFMDDFSYEGPYPNPHFWVNDNVLVNTAMAYNPPSVGVATFDGINKVGNPYGGQYGISDQLTSAVLDFTGVSDTSQYLSFYLEPKGAGYPPKLDDAFLVEFRDKNGFWRQQTHYLGLPNNTLPGDSTAATSTFTYHRLPISTFFQGDAFQVRFSNIGNRTGFTQLWHLDYVRIGNTYETDSLAFQDLAMVTTASPLLKKYTAMPWKHFVGREKSLLNFVAAYTTYNFFDQKQTFPPPKVEIVVKENKQSILNTVLVTPANTNPRHFLSVVDTLDAKSLLTNIQSFVPSGRATFVTKYMASVAQNPKYHATVQNDTISSTTVFDNYFSYDDGIAEGAIAAKGVGSKVAVKYTTTIDDSLQAIQFYFPQVKEDVSNQQFNLLVWVKELKDTANYILEKRHPVYASKITKTPGGFSTYPFLDGNNKPKPIFIPKGKFYIGWEQVTGSADGIPIGIDKNGRTPRQFLASDTLNIPPTWTLAEDSITTVFQNFNGNWQRGPRSLKGVIMIHPVMAGGTTVENTTVLAMPEIPLASLVQIAPNPANDYLNIVLKEGYEYQNLQYTLYNSLGQALERGNLEAQLALNNCENGIYFLNIKNKKTNQQFSHKFVVIK
jgi:Secretion system C-terminal sorting domain